MKTKNEALPKPIPSQSKPIAYGPVVHPPIARQTHAGAGSDHQRVLERRLGERHRAFGGDQHLLLELDALLGADLADIALDRERHILLEDTVVAPVREVAGIGDA